MIEQPLTRAQLTAVIEGRGAAPRVPAMVHFWVNPHQGPPDWQQSVEQILGRYPHDVQVVPIHIPAVYDAPDDEPGYRWMNCDRPEATASAGLDAQIAISDWAQLDDILADFPNPRSPHLLPENPEPDGRYRLGHWWYCLFERHWSLRGMENALLDFYTAPEAVKRLYRALTDFYLVAMERSKKELGIDGIFTSDDLGGQHGPMFSPAVYDEFFKPFYTELIAKAHALGMHFWLHACGNIEPFIPSFTEMGLDVLHPIQKYTMDERTIARKYGDKLCIWAGFDVQQIIPWGSPEDVRREVRFMIDTYQRPEGRLILGAGNAIHEDCPPASLEALLDESCRYRPWLARE